MIEQIKILLRYESQPKQTNYNLTHVMYEGQEESNMWAFSLHYTLKAEYEYMISEHW